MNTINLDFSSKSSTDVAAIKSQPQSIPYKLYKLNDSPETTVKLTRDEAKSFYRDMQLIRRMELAAINLYKEKTIRGFCHLYSGQEAVAVGMRAALRPQDSVITAYRCHGWTYVMGVSVENLLAELCSRATGCSRGKAGSMHMYAPNYYGGNGIVGAGVAFANKYKGNNGICLALYGDGAANQGQVFEVYNMAMLWQLPIVFVCENNGCGLGSEAHRAAANTNYYTRGDVIPGIWFDGMDVLAAREVTRYAINHCTSGKGPIVLEASTYRYFSHSMSDPGTSYGSKDEVQQVRKMRDDPIISFKTRILQANLVTKDELTNFDKDIKTLVDKAFRKAKETPEIETDELATDIYSNNVEKTIRNVLPDNPLTHKRIGKAVNL